MQLQRRIGQWVAWGSLGPLLVSMGGIFLLNALRLLQSDRDEYQDPLVMAAAVADGLTLVVGALLVLKPRTPAWLALVVAVAMCAANLVSDLSVSGLALSGFWNAVFWALEASLLTFYVFHCHVRGYRWGAPLIPSEPNHVPAKPGAQGIRR